SGIVGSAFFSIAWLFGAPARELANELRVCAANFLGRRQTRAATRECYALRARFRRMRLTTQAIRTHGGMLHAAEFRRASLTAASSSSGLNGFVNKRGLISPRFGTRCSLSG